MDDSSGNSEDQKTNRNADSKDCACEVSDGNEVSMEAWTKGHLCYIVAKNLATICLCPETLC
jgi:hypothetical protein